MQQGIGGRVPACIKVDGPGLAVFAEIQVYRDRVLMGLGGVGRINGQGEISAPTVVIDLMLNQTQLLAEKPDVIEFAQEAS